MNELQRWQLWAKEQDAILERMEDCLYEMKTVAERASVKGLPVEVKKDLKYKMRVLTEELNFLEQQRTPFDAVSPLIN